MRTGNYIVLASAVALAAAGRELSSEPEREVRDLETVRVRVHADSEAPGYEAYRALDGDIETMWHTRWEGGETPHPHQLVIDLGRSYDISGFAYTPRRGAGNGTIAAYELRVSDHRNLSGPPVAAGTFERSESEKRVELSALVRGRYVELRALSEAGGRPWTSVAELRILSEGRRFIAAARGQLRASLPPDRTLRGALDLARRTLAFIEESVPRPRLARELETLEKRAERRETALAPDREALLAEVRALRRRIILSHPLLDFERLLINKRPPPAFSHQSDQYLGRYSGVGDGLVILDSWKDGPRETVLFRGKLPAGSILHPDLSFDGTRVLFSFCDHRQPDARLRRFFIWEASLDGSFLRQVTGTREDPLEGAGGRRSVLIEDFDPCYLPGGGIAFVSTRNQGGVRCHHGERYCPTYTLYRAEADGTGIRPLAFGEANEWDPSVLHDGRIIWTRWDYINRHDTLFQSLWTVRPDGTSVAHFYGNYTPNPCSIAEARAIPGSHRIVATATAHHSYTAGSIIIVDPLHGHDGEAPTERVTPEVPFPETEGWPAGSYATPWPLSEDLFLVAYSPEKHASQGARQSRTAYGIYLIDTLGGRELIYRDPAMSCFTPLPIEPRPMPPALAPASVPGEPENSGVFFVQDVYRSTEEIPRGSIAALRVVEVLPQTTQRVPDRSIVLFEVAKRIAGTVSVGEDGSVAFRAPAGKPLLFQLLDGNGMAVMSMRSFTYLQAGEEASCAGCHEPRTFTPAPTRMPAGLLVEELRPPAGPRYEGGLSFARTVQPVLDRHCIRCHGLDETAGGVDLLGTMASGPIVLGRVHASKAYASLTGRPGLVSVAHRNRETSYSRPKDYFAHAGRLARMLLYGDDIHERLDRDDLQRVIDWLDLNAPFYGDYSWNKAEWRRPSPSGERELRAHVRETFGPALAEQPLAALVNAALPEASRILMAPLAVEAGGWGQIVENGWTTRDDPGFRAMRRLVEAAFLPLEAEDVAGTCARMPCVCGGCWVRESGRSFEALR